MIILYYIVPLEKLCQKSFISTRVSFQFFFHFWNTEKALFRSLLKTDVANEVFRSTRKEIEPDRYKIAFLSLFILPPCRYWHKIPLVIDSVSHSFAIIVFLSCILSDAGQERQVIRVGYLHRVQSFGELNLTHRCSSRCGSGAKRKEREDEARIVCTTFIL